MATRSSLGHIPRQTLTSQLCNGSTQTNEEEVFAISKMPSTLYSQKNQKLGNVGIVVSTVKNIVSKDLDIAYQSRFGAFDGVT